MQGKSKCLHWIFKIKQPTGAGNEADLAGLLQHLSIFPVSVLIPFTVSLLSEWCRHIDSFASPGVLVSFGMMHLTK